MINKLKFLTKESIKQKTKTKWFKIANIIVLILLIIIANIDRIVGFFGGDFLNKTTIVIKDEVGIYDSFKESFEQYANALKEMKHYEITKLDKELTEEINELKEEKDKLVLEIKYDEENILNANLTSYEDIDTVSKQLISQTLNNLKTSVATASLGLSESQVKAILSPVNINTTLTNPDAKDQEGKDLVTTGVIMVFIFPCFFLITLLVQMVGAEINDEKSTRSMEIIISNVSPKTHFLSKILSSTLFVAIEGALIVFDAIIAVLIRFLLGGTELAGISSEATEGLTNILKIISETGIIKLLLQGIPVILILFLVSFILYAIVSGVLASMTTSIEDFQQLQTPLMIILMLGYYLALMASLFEGSLFVKIASYIPMLSFLLSPTLFMLGQIELWQMLLSTIITTAFTVLIFNYGLRIYKVGILNYSSTKLWKKMFTSLKNKNVQKNIK